MTFVFVFVKTICKNYVWFVKLTMTFWRQIRKLAKFKKIIWTFLKATNDNRKIIFFKWNFFSNLTNFLRFEFRNDDILKFMTKQNNHIEILNEIISIVSKFHFHWCVEIIEKLISNNIHQISIYKFVGAYIVMHKWRCHKLFKLKSIIFDMFFEKTWFFVFHKIIKIKFIMLKYNIFNFFVNVWNGSSVKKLINANCKIVIVLKKSNMNHMIYYIKCWYHSRTLITDVVQDDRHAVVEKQHLIVRIKFSLYSNIFWNRKIYWSIKF